MCRSSSFPLQASATSDLCFAGDPVRRNDDMALPAEPARTLGICFRVCDDESL
jgi:hypothetical protein